MILKNHKDLNGKFVKLKEKVQTNEAALNSLDSKAKMINQNLQKLYDKFSEENETLVTELKK